MATIPKGDVYEFAYGLIEKRHRDIAVSTKDRNRLVEFFIERPTSYKGADYALVSRNLGGGMWQVSAQPTQGGDAQ